jgi:hypothetical protein
MRHLQPRGTFIFLWIVFTLLAVLVIHFARIV